MSKNTLVLGASPNPSRYAYIATKMLKEYGHQVWPVGIRKGNIEGLDIIPASQALSEAVHTVTLYLSPDLQEDYFDYLLKLKPERVIFNPGTENPIFANKLRQAMPNIDLEQACTLVLLRTEQY